MHYFLQCSHMFNSMWLSTRQLQKLRLVVVQHQGELWMGTTMLIITLGLVRTPGGVIPGGRWTWAAPTASTLLSFLTEIQLVIIAFVLFYVNAMLIF